MIVIRLTCSSCKAQMKLSGTGKPVRSVKCPRCRNPIPVPDPDEVEQDVEIVEEDVFDDFEIVEDEDERPAAKKPSAKPSAPKRPQAPPRKSAPAAEEEDFEVVEEEEEPEVVVVEDSGERPAAKKPRPQTGKQQSAPARKSKQPPKEEEPEEEVEVLEDSGDRPPPKKKPARRAADEEQDEPPHRKSKRDRDEEDEEDEEEERPARRGKGRARPKEKSGQPVLLWAGLAGGGVLLIGGVVLAVVLMRSDKGDGQAAQGGPGGPNPGGPRFGGASRLPRPPSLVKRAEINTGLPGRVFIDANRVEHSGGISWIALSGDGKIAAVSRSIAPKNIRVFDVVNNKPLATFSRGREGDEDQEAPLIALSPDGTRLALEGGINSTLALHDTRTGELVRELKAQEKGGLKLNLSLVEFRFSPKGDAVYGVSSGGDVVGWNSTSGDLLFHRDKSMEGGILHLRVSPDGNKLATSGRDLRTIAIHDSRSGDKLQALTIGQEDGLESFALSADGSVIGAVMAGSKGKAFLWELPSGKHLLTAGASTGRHIGDSFFLKDPKTLYYFDRTGSEGRILYWNADAGDEQGTWSDEPLKGIKAVATTPDRSVLAIFNAEGVLTLYDVQG
jgi:hypothetical protein